MRVISGKYKGKKLLGFNVTGTRPTMDRVKESLFGIIQNYLKNSIFLDLFAGSGSIGIEALSNGSNKCYFVDNNEDILKLLQSNLKGINNSIVVKNDYKNALKAFKDQNIKFDIIYIDPPYSLNLANYAFKLIKKYNLIKENGIIIVEYENENIEDIYQVLRFKKYGKTNIKIFINS